jgi:hypothetical protein
MTKGLLVAMASGVISIALIEHIALRMKLKLKLVATETRKVFEESDG